MVEGDADWYDAEEPAAPFTYARRPLAEWLVDLVSDDHAKRNAAGGAVLAIGQPYRFLNPTPEQIREYQRVLEERTRFPAVVRRVVDEPGFPKAWFVRALCEHRVAVQESWEWVVARKVERQERAADRVVARFEADPSAPGADDTFHRRLARVYCGSRREEHEAFSNAHSAAYLVFGALDSAFLADPEALIRVLRQRVLSDSAAKAIARIGPAGRDAFAELLLAELDTPGDKPREPRSFQFADALAAVVRDDPELIRGVIRRALTGPWAVAGGAIDTLGALGPSVLRLDADLVAKLLRRDVPEPRFPVALHPALGRIGRDDAKLLGILLDLARPRPPRVVRGEGGYEWDMTRSERGAALESLANFTRFPDRVVPVLVDAIDTFEEYDPDWGYERDEHGRVVASLRAFGPAAAPAVPVLARHVRQSNGEVDWEVIRLLGDIGPLAAAALPALEALNNEFADAEGPGYGAAEETEPPDRATDPLGWTIWRIRGMG